VRGVNTFRGDGVIILIVVGNIPHIEGLLPEKSSLGGSNIFPSPKLAWPAGVRDMPVRPVGLPVLPWPAGKFMAKNGVFDSFGPILTQATLDGRPGQGIRGKKIVQNSNEGQWAMLSRDMCARPVGRTVWPHRPAENPQKQQFLTIFATFDGGCRPNGRADRLRPHIR
jgi:hypothetical protein